MDVATRLTGAELAFAAERHEYRTPAGLLVPSVTAILKATGVATDFDEIAGRSQKLGDAIEYKRALGIAAHADCHAFDDRDLDWSAVHPDVEPYVRAWETFRGNTGLRPIARERRVFHAGEFFCGTLDGVFEKDTHNNRCILIDIKIGDPASSGARYQTAAYEAAYRHEHPGARIDERWAVQLFPGRGVPYRITCYTGTRDSWRDYHTFQSFLVTYRHQAGRRDA